MADSREDDWSFETWLKDNDILEFKDMLKDKGYDNRRNLRGMTPDDLLGMLPGEKQQGDRGAVRKAIDTLLHESVSPKTKKLKLDNKGIALSRLALEFAIQIPNIDYYLMSDYSVNHSLQKLGHLAAPLVPSGTIYAAQKQRAPWLEIEYPCRTYEYQYVSMKYLPDITADFENISSTFSDFVHSAVSTELRNVQDNKFVMVPASQGSGKTTLAFLLARMRYVVFVDTSAKSGSFEIIRNIAAELKATLDKIVQAYPEVAFSLHVYYNLVIERALKLYFAVHIKLLIAFHRQYYNNPKRQELFLRYLLNGGKSFPKLWLKEQMKIILADQGDTVDRFYSNLLQELSKIGITSTDVAFFVDELPSQKNVLKGAFLRKKYLLGQSLSATQQQEALNDTDETSLLYVTRLVCLTLIGDNQFPLPMVGAGTDIGMAIQQEVLPSPYTRNNLAIFTRMVHVTVNLVIDCIQKCVSPNIDPAQIRNIAWKWEGRILWLAEYLLGNLWSSCTSQATALEALLAADGSGFPQAIDKAKRLAQEFISGTQVFDVEGEIISARSLMRKVYYALIMRGGKLDLPGNVIWELVDKGLVHVHEALTAPVLSDSQPDDEPTFVKRKAVTIAEPIMQIGMRMAFASKALTDDPILCELSERLCGTVLVLGKGLSYHGNFGERIIARLLQIKGKNTPISLVPGFEVLRGTVFDFYKLSVESFGSPEDFGIGDVEAICCDDYHKGYFPNNNAGPDVKLSLKKLSEKELLNFFEAIDASVHGLCPPTALAASQEKCRTKPTDVGALRSVDPSLFYKVRKVPKRQPEDVDSQVEEEEQQRQSEARSAFDEWLRLHGGAYDVYLRIIYSHSGFGADFVKQHREYCRCPVARLRPIVLLDGNWLDAKSKPLFEHICGTLETPLSPGEDQELIARLIEEEEHCKTAAETKNALRSLGLYLTGTGLELKKHLNDWLHWNNNHSADKLDIGVPMVNATLLNKAKNMAVPNYWKRIV